MTLAQPVSPCSTSYHRELVALQLALDFCSNRIKQCPRSEVHLFCDCQAAMLAVASPEVHQSHQILIDQIQSTVSGLKQSGTNTHIYWVAGHVNLVPNELADLAAKDAATQAETKPPDSKVSVMQKNRHLIKSKWQREWDI